MPSEGKHSGADERITVVEHENARVGDISSYPKEVLQCCKDMVGYFSTKHKGDVELNRGASENDLADLSAAPEALRMLLEECNGGLWVYDYQLLSTDEIAGVTVAGRMTPFARNIDGDLLVTGNDDQNGGVFEADESGDVGTRRDENMAVFLERYLNELLSNKLEFVEECGMMEKVDSTPGTKSKK